MENIINKFGINMISVMLSVILTKLANNQPLNEGEQFTLAALYGKVVDKDTEAKKPKSKDEWFEFDLMWATSLWGLAEQTIKDKSHKGRNYTTKAHLRDKAKAGYRKGAARMGWSHYDRWLKPERKKKDLEKDTQAQMDEYNQETSWAVDYALLEIQFPSVQKGIDKVFYLHSKDFALLDRWFNLIKEWEDDSLAALPSYKEVYETVISIYPEIGDDESRHVVDTMFRVWNGHISTQKKMMWEYCLDANKRYKEKIEYDLKQACQDLDKLTKDAQMDGLSESLIEQYTKEFNKLLKEIRHFQIVLADMQFYNCKYF